MRLRFIKLEFSSDVKLRHEVGRRQLPAGKSGIVSGLRHRKSLII